MPLSSWLGWQDLNLRMPESKSGALPLGDIPMSDTEHYSTGKPKLQYLFWHFWGGGIRKIENCRSYRFSQVYCRTQGTCLSSLAGTIIHCAGERVAVTPSPTTRGVVGTGDSRKTKKEHTPIGCVLHWSRVRESNPPSRLGKPLYYRYTNPAFPVL